MQTDRMKLPTWHFWHGNHRVEFQVLLFQYNDVIDTVVRRGCGGCKFHHFQPFSCSWGRHSGHPFLVTSCRIPQISYDQMENRQCLRYPREIWGRFWIHVSSVPRTLLSDLHWAPLKPCHYAAVGGFSPEVFDRISPIPNIACWQVAIACIISTEDGSHSVQQVHLHIEGEGPGDYFCLFLPLWSLFAWMPVRGDCTAYGPCWKYSISAFSFLFID